MNAHTSLSETGNDRIAAGANNPPADAPSPFDLIVTEIEDLYMEAKNWADGEAIATQAVHDEIERLYGKIGDAAGRAEAMRAAEVKPIDLEREAVQARFHPLIGDNKTAGKGKAVLAKLALNTLLSAWRTKVKLAKEAAAQRAREDAEKLAEEARLAMQSSRGDLEARERAEDAVGLAREAAKFADRTERKAATGNGLRTVYTAELTDFNVAARHYWKSHRDRFEALVIEIANEQVRFGTREIPGFKITSTAKAL